MDNFRGTDESLLPPNLIPPTHISDNRSEPTTAVNKQNIENGIPGIIPNGTGELDNALNPSRLSRQSIISDQIAMDLDYETDAEGYERQYEDDLQSILHGFMRHDINRTRKNTHKNKTNYLGLNIFPNYDNLNEAEFYNRYIKVDKSSNNSLFHDKLKHFFILSAAGKPIYSLHGDDEVIMGYMGLITTVVSTFEEKFGDQIQSIDYGDMKIVVMNMYPVIYVAISKITHETLLDENGKNDVTLRNQLINLSNYLVSVLSKPTISKNFNNRMNYDLRKMLSPLDLQNLDDICMKLTYGIDSTSEYNSLLTSFEGFEYFLSNLLNASASLKISHTVRTKLRSILLSSKRLKIAPPHNDTLGDSLMFFKREEEVYLGDEVLFAFLISPKGRIICDIRPKQHSLSRSDKELLISMVLSLSGKNNNSITEDLWVPLCMPEFNSNGFLHVFVRKFDLGTDYGSLNVKNLRLILISGNKNSFFLMKEVSEYLLKKIEKRTVFKENLIKELVSSQNCSILNDIRVPYIKHFIFKLKKYNQYFMSSVEDIIKDQQADSYFQLVYFYSILKNLKATKIKMKVPQNGNIMGPNKIQDKKLSYCKWDSKMGSFTGFMLSDNKSEFYCICDDVVNSKDLIRYSLKIIHWCIKYERRLFTDDDGVF